MEPLSALSLACSVVQLVEQAIKVAGKCKEIYDRGSLEENDRLEESAKDIAEANTEVQTQLLGARISGRDVRLKKIAQDCINTATELDTTLKLIKFEKNRKSVVKAWVRTAIKRGKIEKLQKSLQEHDRLLQSGLLKDLW